MCGFVSRLKLPSKEEARRRSQVPGRKNENLRLVEYRTEHNTSHDTSHVGLNPGRRLRSPAKPPVALFDRCAVFFFCRETGETQRAKKKGNVLERFACPCSAGPRLQISQGRAPLCTRCVVKKFTKDGARCPRLPWASWSQTKR